VSSLLISRLESHGFKSHLCIWSSFVFNPQAFKTNFWLVCEVTSWPHPSTRLSNSLFCNHCTVQSIDIHCTANNFVKEIKEPFLVLVAIASLQLNRWSIRELSGLLHFESRQIYKRSRLNVARVCAVREGFWCWWI